MTAEGVQAAARAAKQMTLQEAEMILGTEAGAPWPEVLKVGVPAHAVLGCAGLSRWRQAPLCPCTCDAAQHAAHKGASLPGRSGQHNVASQSPFRPAERQPQAPCWLSLAALVRAPRPRL